MTEIFLIRHTQAEGNVYRMMQGHWDGDITALGRREIDLLAERFKDERIDAVYSSDLYRARMTAGAITKYHDLPLHTDTALRELNVGSWETVFFGNIAHTDPLMVQKFMQQPAEWHVDGAETYFDVQARAYKALCEIAARHEGQRVAVVSHGVTIRCIIAKVLGTPIERFGEVPIVNNTAVTALNYDNGIFSPVYINDYSHLDSLEIPAWKRNSALRDAPIDLKYDDDFYCDCYAGTWIASHGDLEGFSAPAYLHSAQEHCKSDPDSVLVIYDGDKPVGLIDMDVRRGAADGIGWISLIYLRPDYRGQGYGIQVLARAIKKYSALGRRELRLHVAQDNAAAIKFYTEYGFEPLGEQRGAVGMQLLMRRELRGENHA